MAELLRGRDALLEMLQTRRPAWSKSERKWINKWIMPLGCQEDTFGNLWLRIGDAPVLWSSHTDTVHRIGGTQRLAMDNDGKVFLHPEELVSNCLGADDTSGVWLMREMILNNVPGLYIFHRDEESGGRGSAWIANNLSHKLEGIKWAIALDRKGYTDVITYQWGRCCSDTFAKALGDALGMGYKPDESGLFTDTANYTGLIPECTNVSVGYGRAHSPDEWQDVDHIEKLLTALCAIDLSVLPVDRDPAEDEHFTYDDRDDQGNGWDEGLSDYYSGQSSGHTSPDRERINLIRNNAEAVSEFLMHWGVDTDELREVIHSYSGFVKD